MANEDYIWSPEEELITEYNTVGKPRKYLKGVDMITSEYVPTIETEDITRGYVNRYFVRQVNYPSDGEILEVSRNQYNKVKDLPLYRAIELRWKIAGPIENIPVGAVDNPNSVHYLGIRDSNKKSLEIAERKLPGISKRLPNLLQYRVSE